MRGDGEVAGRAAVAGQKTGCIYSNSLERVRETHQNTETEKDGKEDGPYPEVYELPNRT